MPVETVLCTSKLAATSDSIASTESGSKVDRFATLAILIAAYGVLAWQWLFSDRAWFHVELFNVSEYVWSGPRLASLGAKLRVLFDWRVFDVSPYRLRTLSDFVEVVDAISRPFLKPMLGVHPSATVIGIALAATIPAISFNLIRRLGLPRVHAALLVLLLVSTIGFLSSFIPYIRPAKKLALVACCLVPYLCIELQQRFSRKHYTMLLITLFVGFFADETCYALLPISLLLLGRPMIHRRGWVEFLGFVALLLLFVIASRLVLPQIYLNLGTSGPRDETVAGQIVARLLGYLLSPQFYGIALDDFGTSVLSSVGIIDASQTSVIAFLTVFFLVTASSLILTFRADQKHSAIFWNLAVFAGSSIALSFSLTLFDWFNNPYSSNYFGALTYYYHSAIAPMVVFWLACLARAIHLLADSRARKVSMSVVLVAFCSIAAISNLGNFKAVNRLFQIIHTYPLDAQALIGTPWKRLENFTVNNTTHNIDIAVSAPLNSLGSEYERILQRSIGPRTANFQDAINIYKRNPLGTRQFVQRYVRLFYPDYTVNAIVTPVP